MKREPPIEVSNPHRREFFRKSIMLSAFSAAGLLTMCRRKDAGEVTPTEDLMREHGLLNRVLLIYDNCRYRLINKIKFDLSVLNRSAQIIRDFVEDYHERQEEEFVFTRFERKNKLADLTKILRAQHLAGRTLTDQILEYGKLQEEAISEDQRQKLINLLDFFNRMYRPHEAREDTVLFPSLRSVVTAEEFDEMGEKFEEREHQLFGKNGFDKMVEKVATIERLIAIEDLSQFTPKV
jgi:hemerythrin-like domain-containing protein